MGERVAAVVVNYNARDLLIECLASLRREGVGELVVADNASTDGSREAVAAADPDARFVETGGNLGYGRGANRGAAALRSDAELLLVLNPDVVLHDGALDALAAALDADPHIAIAGPRIVNPDGSLYPSVRTFPSLVDAVGHAVLGPFVANPWTRRYQRLDWDHATASDADWVSGACFLMRRTAWDAIAGFDETYFMFMEDVDLCWRAHRAGWRVVYEPAATVTHLVGASRRRHPYRMLAAHHRSMLRFASRTSTGSSRALLPVLAVGLAAHLGTDAARLFAERRRARTPRPGAPAAEH